MNSGICVQITRFPPPVLLHSSLFYMFEVIMWLFFLKHLLNCLGEENPRRSDISEILNSGFSLSMIAARFNRTVRIKSYGVCPVMAFSLVNNLVRAIPFREPGHLH